MHFAVFIDLIFFVTAVMDFIVLFIMKELLREVTTVQRLSIAAFIASAGSCLVLVLPLPAFMRVLILYGGVSIATLEIAFSIKSGKDYMIKAVSFFGVAFFVDGFLNFLDQQFAMKRYLESLVQGTPFEKVKIINLIVGIGGLLICYPVIAALIGYIRENVLLLRRIKLVNEGKAVKATGLLDTGNMLFDPFTGEPVVIAEFSLIRNLFTPEQQLMLAAYIKMNRALQKDSQQEDESEELFNKIHMIPFHSVGKEEGLLVAVRLDFIEIGEQSGAKRRENVLVGLYPGKLSAKETYRVILHSSII